VVEPSPNSPSALSPIAHRLPSLFRNRLKSLPAAIAVIVVTEGLLIFTAKVVWKVAPSVSVAVTVMFVLPVALPCGMSVRLLLLTPAVTRLVLAEVAVNVSAGIWAMLVKIKSDRVRFEPLKLANGTWVQAPWILACTVALLEKLKPDRFHCDNCAIALATAMPLPNTVPKAQKPPSWVSRLEELSAMLMNHWLVALL